MHLLIFSDSHRHPENIREVLRRAGHYDGVIFLGDGLRDIPYAEIDLTKLYSVKGNCDIFDVTAQDAPESRIIELSGKRIFITHGHKYGVKSSLDSLIYAAAEANADVALFGHTHIPYERRLTPDNSRVLSKPLYLFNPGAVGDYNGSFGCMDITPHGEILLSHGEI